MIIHALPPNYEQLAAAFPLTGNEIFTYAPDVYVPSGEKLTPALQMHEEMHLRQQGNDPAGWWERYLAEPDFRLAHELEAHRVEYRIFCVHVKDRNVQARYADAIGRRLASAMYGNLITHKQATKAIRDN